MASGSGTADNATGAPTGSVHTGDLNAPDTGVDRAGDQGDAADKQRSRDRAYPPRFLALESAIIDRIYGGNRTAYETDYPHAKGDPAD